MRLLLFGDHHLTIYASYMQVMNHGIDVKLMEKVKELVNLHYENKLKESFYQSEIAKSLENKEAGDIDWESSFFIWHRPTSNIDEIPNLPEGFGWVFQFISIF